MERPNKDDLINIMRRAGFGHLAELKSGFRNTRLCVVSLRDVTQTNTLFGDFSFLLDPTVDRVLGWRSRTTPSVSELKRNRHKDGVSIIAPGWSPGCWMLGFHNHDEDRPALRQVDTIKVHRDGDGDSIAEWTKRSKLFTNAKGINFHDWKGSSAGCPTMSKRDLDEMLLRIRFAQAAGADERIDCLLIEPLLVSA